MRGISSVHARHYKRVARFAAAGPTTVKHSKFRGFSHRSASRQHGCSSSQAAPNKSTVNHRFFATYVPAGRSGRCAGTPPWPVRCPASVLRSRWRPRGAWKSVGASEFSARRRLKQRRGCTLASILLNRANSGHDPGRQSDISTKDGEARPDANGPALILWM